MSYTDFSRVEASLITNWKGIYLFICGWFVKSCLHFINSDAIFLNKSWNLVWKISFEKPTTNKNPHYLTMWGSNRGKCANACERTLTEVTIGTDEKLRRRRVWYEPLISRHQGAGCVRSLRSYALCKYHFEMKEIELGVMGRRNTRPWAEYPRWLMIIKQMGETLVQMSLCLAIEAH